MLLHIHPDNPSKRKINIVVDTLKRGGIIIYPTDTLYAFACSLNNYKSAEQIIKIKGKKITAKLAKTAPRIAQTTE